MSLPPKITITHQDLAAVDVRSPGAGGSKLVIALDSGENKPKKPGSASKWVVFVAAVGGVAAGLLAAMVLPRADWVGAIDQAADRGVVLIQVDATGLLSQVK